MNGSRRSGPGSADPAAENQAFGPAFGYLVLALLVVAGAIACGVSLPEEPVRVASSGAALPAERSSASSASSGTVPVEPALPEAAAAASAPAPAAAPIQIPRMREPSGDQTPDLSDYVNAGEKPTMNHVIERLHRAGVTTGLGAFNPPGTRPHLMGLAVPEDFTLPEGYVRHYQTTDDGQRIEPILMYARDRPFFDATARPITVPDHRVVPPEFAPPGLPIRCIVIPAPVEPR